MVCSADDLVEWKDFPKGLRVLLLDEDDISAAETRLKLEAMDYIVISFKNEEEALRATLKKNESFHVAIVEVTAENSNRSFRFLELAKDLPIVVISNVSSLNTMMRCIALGAAEFLEKPLSEDKLRNIWQHVVHKVFNPGENLLPESLKPVKETISSMLQLVPETSELGTELKSEARNVDEVLDHDTENSVSSEKFSAPSTPQLKQGVRQLGDGTYHDPRNFLDKNECLLEVERINNSSNSKSVEITCSSVLKVNLDSKKEVAPSRLNQPISEEVNSTDVTTEGSVPSRYKRDCVESLDEEANKTSTILRITSHSRGNRGGSRKRIKVDWTVDLHRRFVQAVEQLGITEAIPSKILELMNVEGLTRHNVASHLQKFRMQRRLILPKDDNRRWHTQREPLPRNYMHKPPVIFPHFHSHYGVPQQHVYPVWGHPSYLQSGYQMLGHGGFLPWQQSAHSWPLKNYSAVHADTWDSPVAPVYNQYNFSAQNQPSNNGLDVRDRNKLAKDHYDVNMAEEMIDQVVMDVMSKPWLPLPLGLKPPSTDGVLAELHRQGILNIPPPSRTSS